MTKNLWKISFVYFSPASQGGEAASDVHITADTADGALADFKKYSDRSGLQQVHVTAVVKAGILVE